MATVILPTRTWGPVPEELIGQLRDDDELLLVCDRESDEVTDHRDVPGVRVVIAGDPEGCSGKANAVAAGLERATHDVIVCTDDDFVHGDGWLDAVRERTLRRGAVSTVPIFRSENAFGTLLEPAFLVFGALIFLTGSELWGGTIGFDRSRVDVDALVADLRRTVSDDVLVGSYVPDATVDLSLMREVPVEGSLADVRNRGARFVRTVLFWDPRSLVVTLAVLLVALAGTLVAPLPTALVLTAGAALAYAAAGYRRWTFLLAFPGFLLAFVVTLYGLAQPEFAWGGRRYRWTGRFEVEVLD